MVLKIAPPQSSFSLMAGSPSQPSPLEVTVVQCAPAQLDAGAFVTVSPSFEDQRASKQKQQGIRDRMFCRKMEVPPSERPFASITPDPLTVTALIDTLSRVQPGSNGLVGIDYDHCDLVSRHFFFREGLDAQTTHHIGISTIIAGIVAYSTGPDNDGRIRSIVVAMGKEPFDVWQEGLAVYSKAFEIDPPEKRLLMEKLETLEFEQRQLQDLIGSIGDYFRYRSIEATAREAAQVLMKRAEQIPGEIEETKRQLAGFDK